MTNNKKYLIIPLFFASSFIQMNCINKTNEETWPTKNWERSKPDTQGMNSDSLSAFSKKLASGELGYIDDMLVIRNGKIIFETSYTNDYDSLFRATDTKPNKYNYYDTEWHPYYKKSKLHTMQSISKSFTSAAIGIAIKKGHLESVEQSIMPYFSEYNSSNPDTRRKNITIENLLTMTTGIAWDELSMPYTDTTSSCVQMEATQDWVRFVLNQPIAHDPGKKWEYSSGATMLLSHIITEATGRDLAEYLEENLFNKIGIKDYFWKHTDSGLTDAEGGLYLEPKDLAKFGYLYLNNGAWNGEQVLPQNWVENNLNKPLDTIWPSFKYGHQWWLIPYGENQISMLASGLGGQRMLVIPEFNIIAVFTGWNIYETPALNSWMALHKILNSIIE